MVLKDYFKISIFYSNDNIYPESEYNKRLDEIITFSKKISNDIDVIYDKYNENDYNMAVKGLEHLGERTKRCYECYKLRLEKTAIKAKELNYDYFSTTLSISPYKVEKWINEIGYMLEEKYNIKYLFSDFKKEAGYTDSINLSKEYGLYRQDYCGCKYSLQERDERIARNKEENNN
jgi:predicted adenine nucleotide alpha hydrolase (AANH) superfamily ATPase